jgi:hypothetical protein
MCVAAAQDMQGLLAENDRLVAEVNVLRGQLGGTIMPPSEPMLVTEAMIELMSVKDEVYGEFPAGFGDNWACNSQDPQSGASDPTLAEDDDTRLSPEDFPSTLDPSYHAHTSAHNGPNPIYYELSRTTHTLEQHDLQPWDLVPPMDEQTVPHISSLIDQFTSTHAPLEEYIPTDLPGSLPELSATSIDALPHSWPQDIQMVHNKPNSYIIADSWRY